MDDKDLARAIQLSLQESHNISRSSAIVISDDEDTESRFLEDIKKALEASQERHAPKDSTTENTANATVSTFMSERAKLEKERLERQKRLRPEAFVEVLDDSDEDEERPAKRPQLAASSSKSNSNLPGPSKAPVFWDGELRPTATMHANPRKDGLPTFRLTEILGNTSDLAFAIISSYALDYSWIYSFFNPSVPVILVAQPEASGLPSVKIILPNWIKTTPYLRGGFGCQHMKFMLLFYKDGRLRVVVSTANLISYDWRDMENSVWLQDIPLRSDTSLHNPKGDDFPSVLQRVLHAVNVQPALVAMINDNHPDLPLKKIADIRKWDWSNVKAHLVASIAGKHEGWTHVIQTGHPQLMSVVRKLGMRMGKSNRSKDLVIECQGSSMGSFTTQWLNEFHWSAMGESAEDWLDTSKKSREKLPYPSIRIIFPTKVTVQASAAGEQGGGTIFCRRKQWEAKNFPRDLFYDSKSKAGPVLMHTKMIIAMIQDNPLVSKSKRKVASESEDSDDEEVEVVQPAVGWAYIGSHNFTPSAWGRLSGSGFNPTLNITNYELGVVVLIKKVEDADRLACFQRPPKKYRSDSVPWMQEESPFHQEEEP